MVTWSGMVTEYYLHRGGHTLTSPKGGRPCSLSTLNHVVAGHFGLPINLVRHKWGPVIGTRVLLTRSELPRFTTQKKMITQIVYLITVNQ